MLKIKKKSGIIFKQALIKLLIHFGIWSLLSQNLSGLVVSKKLCQLAVYSVRTCQVLY